MKNYKLFSHSIVLSLYSSPTNKYFDGEVENTNITEDIDDDLKSTISNSIAIINSKMDEFKIADALDELFNIFRRCNKYIDDTMPWALAKDESKKGRLSTVLYNLLECIRISSILLSPFMPNTSLNIFNQLNTDETNYESVKVFGKLKVGSVLNKPEVLFKRIEVDKK